ncbi:MAG: hypothetical protein H6810_09700 [Phycisphaeraceae bacterium]|nr:MAG: hypothetical protein H6810_09700 [Phycisphaeraceae bacterium]
MRRDQAHETATKQRGGDVAVVPSSRDPVERWLDVFIPMTGLPRARAEEIRAELEDHLRARVDDLMITGLGEPEAVQKAVAELGETAELARQFRTALKRRRPVMQTALVAAAGIALFAGYTAFNGNPASAPTTAHVAEAGVHQGGDPLAGIMLDTRAGTVRDVFAQFDDLYPGDILVYWDRLEDIGIEPDQPAEVKAARLPAARFLDSLTRRNPDLGPVATHLSGDLLEISTQEDFDRITTELRPYDIRDLAELRSGFDAGRLALGQNREWEEAAEQIAQTIMNLSDRDAWVDNGGEAASVEIAGASLLVKAPTRIHEQVEHVLGMLREDAERTRELAVAQQEIEAQRDAEYQAKQRRDFEEQSAQRAAQRAVESERREDERQRHIAELEAEFERLTQEVLEIQRWYAEVYEPGMITHQSADGTVKAPDPETRARLNADRNERQLREKDLQIFRDSVRQRLIVLKYGELPGAASANAAQ